MNIHFIIGTLHITYTFFLISILIRAALRFEGYNIINYSISDLGIRRSPSHKVVNASLSFYGIMSALLSFSLFTNLESNVINNTAVGFFLLTSLLCFLVGLLPLDTKTMAHYFVATFAFSTIFITAILMAFLIKQTVWLSNYLIAFNISIAPLSLTQVYFFLKWIKNKKWVKGTWLVEWSVFIIVLVSNALLALNILLASR